MTRDVEMNTKRPGEERKEEKDKGEADIDKLEEQRKKRG